MGLNFQYSTLDLGQVRRNKRNYQTSKIACYSGMALLYAAYDTQPVVTAMHEDANGPTPCEQQSRFQLQAYKPWSD